MRFVLFTYPDPDYAARWTSLTDGERAAEIEEHNAWFEKYGDRIRGGANLVFPKVIRTVRRRAGQPVTTDGPFLETKEILGGLIIVEVDGWQEATAMAADWPSLNQGPGAGVQVEAVVDHSGDA
jgi:hypothetical protein